MSTLQATNLKHGSSASNNIVLDASGNVTFAGTPIPSSTFLRNRIINGGVAIDQRNAGAAQTFTAAAALAYSVDRWYGYCTGANVTGQRVTGSAANTFRYQFPGAPSVTAIGFGTRIEALNPADLVGSTCTLSVDLANNMLTTVTWTAFYANTTDTFGTLASPTRTQFATGTFAVTGTVTRYSTAISVPAAATTGIEIVFTVGAQTSGTWDIGNVQFEPGSAATPFERRQYGQELALCQRYYYQSPKTNVTGSGGWGTMYNTTGGRVWFPLAVTMRADPTVTTSGTTFEYIAVSTATMTVASVFVAPHVVTFDGTGGPATGALGRPFSYNGTVQAAAEL